MGLLQKQFCSFSLVLFVILFSSPDIASASVEEATALLKWKETLQSANNSVPVVLPTWELNPRNGSSSSAGSPCHWFGVSCNAEGSVTRLNLTNSGINGTLETFSFSSFLNLAYVDLSMNELSGPIPPQISSLPLVYLDLSINEFSGNIPPEIGHLTNLKTLHLVENGLNGSIPREIGRLRSLSELALYSNHLSGPIPSSLGNLSNLVSLYLYDNQLFGSIPEEIGNLTNLEFVYMNSNGLTGPIPSTFGNLNRLTELHLYKNTLSGSIPCDWIPNPSLMPQKINPELVGCQLLPTPNIKNQTRPHSPDVINYGPTKPNRQTKNSVNLDMTKGDTKKISTIRMSRDGKF